jgi:hypothetical protein
MLRQKQRNVMLRPTRSVEVFFQIKPTSRVNNMARIIFAAVAAGSGWMLLLAAVAEDYVQKGVF